eukprot:830224-Rhodomonas_salina.1
MEWPSVCTSASDEAREPAEMAAAASWRAWGFSGLWFWAFLQQSCVGQPTFQVQPDSDWKSVIEGAPPNSSVVFVHGRYLGCNVNIVQDISFRSSGGPVILDCQGLARHFYVSRSARVQIDGLEFVNGTVTTGGVGLHGSAGGCLLVADAAHVSITDSLFSGCSAISGGAIYVQDSTLVMHRVAFEGCRSLQSGGVEGL